MSKLILILGGYGNFGKRISKSLVKDGYEIVIAGRNKEKADLLSETLGNKCTTSIFDVNENLLNRLEIIKPNLVINTCGPFQDADYSVAETCIEYGCHYIDLSDGRYFVNGINILDEKAKAKNVLVISGASTVPALSSAVIEEYKDEFTQIDSLRYGISPGAKAPRGLATTQAILGYVGKKLKACAGFENRYGWQDIYRQEFPELGKRWMANCEIPDLDILPQKYGIKKIQFSAGMESWTVHITTWILSWLIRWGLPIDLKKHAKPMLKISKIFDCLGSSDGGMFMIIEGKGREGQELKKEWFIIAKNNDGPQIPCVPAIILAKRILDGGVKVRGARQCIGMVSLTDYISELDCFDIVVR